MEGQELATSVRKLMEDQHKAMMKSLLSGAYDVDVQRRMGSNVYEPGVLASGERAPGLLVGGEASSRAATAPATAPVMQPVPIVTLPPVVRAPRGANPVRPPPVMTPALGAIAITGVPPVVGRTAATPTPRITTPSMAAPRPLDEIVLQYLLSDIDAPRH